MQTRHAFEIMNRLEKVYFRGCATIGETELVKWYGRDRMGPAIWRDLQERWELIQEELRLKAGERSELFVGSGEEDYVFIWGAGLKQDEAVEKGKLFFKPLATYAREPVKSESA